MFRNISRAFTIFGKKRVRTDERLTIGFRTIRPAIEDWIQTADCQLYGDWRECGGWTLDNCEWESWRAPCIPHYSYMDGRFKMCFLEFPLPRWFGAGSGEWLEGLAQARSHSFAVSLSASTGLLCWQINTAKQFHRSIPRVFGDLSMECVCTQCIRLDRCEREHNRTLSLLAPRDWKWKKARSRGWGYDKHIWLLRQLAKCPEW